MLDFAPHRAWLGVFALLVLGLVFFYPPSPFFSRALQAAPKCIAVKTASACDANPQCTWCESYAIPSACYDLKDASGLPDGVFECHKKSPKQQQQQPPSIAQASCSVETSSASCNSNSECVWCESFAIPSKCYSVEDAQRLPEGVFTCAHKDVPVLADEGDQALQVHFTSLAVSEPADEPLCDSKVKQISGYFQIGNTDQHYFFWFFESRSKPKSDPLVLWLTGGPGCASELALFAENGPCTLDKLGEKTINNPHSWNSNANLLFVDQPSGTGFSYGSASAAAKEEKAVAQDLYLFITAFITKYEQYQASKFFLFGESYAGHYVPATGHRIWLGNKRNERKIKINLQGIAVGNGMTNPQLQFPLFPQMAYNSSFAPGLVTEKQYQQMLQAVPLCVKLIELCNLVGGLASCQSALAYCESMLINPISQLGYNLYDMRLKCEKAPLCYDFDNIAKFLNRAEIRAKLGVPESVKQWQECSPEVSRRFVKDWMHNFHMKIPALLEDGIPVLIYVGDQDYICNWLGNKAWAMKLQWSGNKQFNSALDVDWNKGAGRIRRVGAFSFLQVYKAGHMVPMDQPEHALKMLNDFIQTKGAWKQQVPTTVVAAAQ
ncbi:hypothetical protein BASA81_004135 [Batrachochytrium salamandrivorans]|nr:hypothetical protein BASA81_004135 [Batrachochytrium salamandrivorans]